MVSGIFTPKSNKTFDVEFTYQRENKMFLFSSDDIIEKVIVSDLMCRVVKEVTTNENSITFEVSGLKSTVYLVRVMNNKQFVKTIKVII